jgi:hypothetical protein
MQIFISKTLNHSLLLQSGASKGNKISSGSLKNKLTEIVCKKIN